MLFEDTKIDYITAVQGEYDEKFPDERAPQANPNGTHLWSSTSLPTVTIPHFSGAHTEWKAFHDLFRSIVHCPNEKLPGSHFQYLLGALSGEARDLISNFELSDEEYPKAWKTLCDVYNDKPSMFMHLMNKFSSLEPISKEQPENLRELMKATSACLKSLDSVSVDRTQADPIITYLLIRKLPAQTVAYWEETRNRKALPSFAPIQTCIETRIRVASAIANAQGDSVHSASSENNSHHYQSKQQQQQKKRKVSTYHSSTKPSNTVATPSTSSNPPHTMKPAGASKFTCPVCNGEGHPLRTCDKFLAMPATDSVVRNEKRPYRNCNIVPIVLRSIIPSPNAEVRIRVLRVVNAIIRCCIRPIR